MKIGIDARVLLDRKTGDRTYIFNLVRALVETARDHRFILYLDDDPSPDLRSSFPNTQFRISKRPTGYLWTHLALPKLARQDALDLLHVQYMTPFRCHCPVISTIQDISFKLFPEWFTFRDRTVMNAFIPGSIRRAASLIAPSNSTAHNIVTHYNYPPQRISVTPYAAPQQFHAPQDPETIQHCRDRLGIHGPYMLYVGNLQPRKNLTRLVSAFIQARERDAFSERLLIAGQFAWKFAAQRRLLDDAATAGHIIHIGYVDDADLPPLYAAATAFLFPTLHEGFGIPILEAMATGTPVLTSNVSSMPEVAGDAALLVDPTDEATISAAISTLATDRDLRERLTAAGLRRAATFSWHDTAQLTLAAYERFVQ
jgi:glycosyltransferase involved in cell wall biosynthesis